MTGRRILAAMLLCGWSTLAAAQGNARQPDLPPETADVARGWTLLAQRQPAKAAALAGELAARYPKSVAVLALSVDAAIAQGGAAAGLDAYERWLQGKRTEDGYALRRVAQALLRESARAPQDRTQALDALAADGEAPVAGTAPGAAATPGAAFSAGDGRVAELIDSLAKPMINKRAVVMALARTRSPRAVKPTLGLLRDPDPIVRAAAADALGQLGDPAAVAGLTPLLHDPVFTVQLSAATALFALNDMSGLPWLRELQASEHAAIRLAALQAMRTDPDAGWADAVRSLLSDSDPEVRRQAAELIAPHDAAAARAVLEPMLNDSNPAQREAAGQSYVQFAATDFVTLRRFLRAPESGVRVRAAARVLELTR